ncbi:MAG: hypothetical protein KDE09_23200, partial [Anaerolineales bacterium]|nr:hypothetical protein [Anaerolineales bacterium]
SHVLTEGPNEFLLVIPGDVPPGLYLPRLTLAGPAGAIPALTSAAEPRGELFLAPIRIQPFVDRTPPEVYTEEPIPPPFRLEVNEVRLRPDNSLELHLAWLTTATRSQDYNVSLRLTDSAGNFLAQLDTAPGFGFLPSSRWPANEWVNDWLALPLPAELPDEPLVLTARLYEAAPVAQHDAMPQNNNYPTSQWAEGEIVLDQMVIPLTEVAAGTYEVRVGVYRPVDGAFPRLPAIALPDTPLAGDQFILNEAVTVP